MRCRTSHPCNAPAKAPALTRSLRINSSKWYASRSAFVTVTTSCDDAVALPDDGTGVAVVVYNECGRRRYESNSDKLGLGGAAAATDEQARETKLPLLNAVCCETVDFLGGLSWYKGGKRLLPWGVG
eukprot:CAMPEP_0196211310 /NCGR_PEP_ID=MMETSP0912-20130531/16215_1 /TAXON_ID=49265 /ORGANISM="Thalassiosira rotula, Strain GSO102" /LENGTH=126 /DNA_ID=CAMNT_0041486793 /DNA_START=137 /DNA_END=513 /DNA_ORIENTATION=+